MKFRSAVPVLVVGLVAVPALLLAPTLGATDPFQIAAADKGFALLSNGHQHEGQTRELTPEEQAALDKQLAVTARLVKKYPTVAAAEKDGYRRAGPFSPGLGAHWNKDELPDTDGVLDEKDLLSPVLVYDGVEQDSPLAGFMYISLADSPDGFAGPNDHWHHHTNVCLVKRADGGLDSPLGADAEISEEQCAALGGGLMAVTVNMLHVWTVPGYTPAPSKIFSELNPAITCEDGTYYRIALEKIGKRTSICKDAAQA